MYRFIADHNFNDDIIRAWEMRGLTFDLVRARGVGLQHAPDPDILAWASNENRIVLTHDQSTMAGYANDRVIQLLPMPGMFVVDDRARISRVVDDLALIVLASQPFDWVNQVCFVPF